jgi:hypothetical protein
LNNYDLILYKTDNLVSDKYKYNIVRLDKRKLDLNSCLLEDLIVTSNINFIDIQVLYNKEAYNIDFGTDNFYINGNILLDRAFITWFLYKSYGVLIEKDEEYICNIIDHNVNCITIYNHNYINICNNNTDLFI